MPAATRNAGAALTRRRRTARRTFENLREPSGTFKNLREPSRTSGSRRLQQRSRRLRPSESAHRRPRPARPRGRGGRSGRPPLRDDIYIYISLIDGVVSPSKMGLRASGARKFGSPPTRIRRRNPIYPGLRRRRERLEFPGATAGKSGPRRLGSGGATKETAARGHDGRGLRSSAAPTFSPHASRLRQRHSRSPSVARGGDSDTRRRGSGAALARRKPVSPPGATGTSRRRPRGGGRPGPFRRRIRPGGTCVQQPITRAC